VVVLAPAGLGTPLWHGSDRITVLGATSKTTAADLAAAALAGVAHQIADALGALDHDHSADMVRVGGGLSAHDALLQAVADLSGRALEVAADPEVDPRLEAGGRARERSRWHEALEVHVSTGT
jgi:glycerol kinase